MERKVNQLSPLDEQIYNELLIYYKNHEEDYEQLLTMDIEEDIEDGVWANFAEYLATMTFISKGFKKAMLSTEPHNAISDKLTPKNFLGSEFHKVSPEIYEDIESRVWQIDINQVEMIIKSIGENRRRQDLDRRRLITN